ncbi:MAG TPA: NrfD/PsrC family molybdoenzyme membrane anchor subunit [Thermoanaerobaculia bacterium]|nr:NrfD/PsrC family molybdoenzyme membrane anchor subunit [Thermoanaerobaculia bacterium]
MTARRPRQPDATSERRLDELRERAAEEGIVEAPGVRPAGAPMPAAPVVAPSGGDGIGASAVNGYYGRPLLKEPTWTWEVPIYFFVGGAAGAAAVVGAAARVIGGEEDADLVRDARWVAALGGALSAPLLISDLGRPERFLNMLRVWKPQSPMSVGAWTLTAFGSSAGAAAFADLVARRAADGDSRLAVPVRIVGDAAGALAAATGLVMTTYTGVLVGATAIPAWNRSVSVLPMHFAASGLGAAVSLLELLGHRHPALNRLGIAAALAEIATGVVHELDDDPAHAPLKEGSSGALVRAGGVLSGPVPLLLRLFGARKAAAVAALAGSLLTRYGWVAAGHESARDPRVPLGLDPS